MYRSKFLLSTLALSFLLAAASCGGKGEAETAVKAADDAIAAIQPDAEMYAPAEFTQVTSAADSARDLFNQGDYKGARTIAEGVPARADEVKQAAMAAKEAMIKEWTDLEAQVPGMVEAVTAKVNEMAGGKRPPKGMTPEQVAESQSNTETMNQMWSQATTAATAGQIKVAVDGGRQVRAMAEELMVKLGMTTPTGA